MQTTYILFIALYQPAALMCDGYLTDVAFKRFRISCHHWFYNNGKQLSSVRVYCFFEAVKLRSYEFETRSWAWLYVCTSPALFWGGEGVKNRVMDRYPIREPPSNVYQRFGVSEGNP
jgi:hypothetical protein